MPATAQTQRALQRMPRVAELEGPDAFASRVQPRRPREWGFGGPDMHLLDRAAFVDFLAADPAAELLRFGRAGYSVTSESVARHAALGRVAVVVQTSWGGYEFDLAAAAESVRSTWAGVERQLDEAESGDGPRVLAVSSSFELGARFAALDSDGEPDWYRAAKATVFDDALAALTRA